MMVELDRRTKDDETRDTIVVWHDESQMNKFFVENKDDVHTLGPSLLSQSASRHSVNLTQ